MTIVSKNYLTRAGCDDRDAALDRVHELAEALRAPCERGALLGYESAVIASDDDYAEHDLEYLRGRIDAVTGGALPVIWLNLTFAAPVPDDDGVAALIDRFALVHLLTEEADG